MFRRLCIVLSLLTAGFGSTACDSLADLSRCTSLSGLTREQLGRVAALDAQSPNAVSAEAYGEMGRIYMDLELQLSKREQELQGELQQALANYRTTLRSIARECEQYSTSLEALTTAAVEENASRTRTATHQLKTIRKRAEAHERAYQAALDRINRACAVR